MVDQFSLDPNQGDTRAIYALSPRAAGDKIHARWQNTKADAYLITGTGLPTLRVVAELSETCRPGAVLESVPGLGDPASGGHRPRRRWRRPLVCHCWVVGNI